ncbi:hypothetical protein BDN70DRAFT_890119 [Pholiota conissans]|uniref:GATA-type domain-containing protein n=1 Tax=Pholiota conissans TaxID=109636 RepID=A0A9P5ZDN1_9AGAR|nr:hypothetical protein BDN70DRAFT_890119 [Pholiota conissans]
MLQNATYGVQMLNAALRHTQSGISAASASPSSLLGGSSGVGPSTTSTNSLAMANTMPPAPPSTSGSSVSSSTSHYQQPHGHAGNVRSNSTSPKVNTKEDMRMVEDGPAPTRGMKTENASGKEGANGSGGAAMASGAANDRVKRQKTDDGPSEGQTCLGCAATSTPEWRRGPMGPRTLCNACGLVYAKMIKKRYKDKATHPKKLPNSNAGSGKLSGAGGMTSILSSNVGGLLHVISPNESDDEGSEEDDEYGSHGRRSENPD